MIMQRKILCVSLLLGTLGGCSWLSDDEGWFVDRRDDYIDAEQLPPLQVPGDMAATPLQDPFPIPPLAERNNPQ